MLQKCQEGNILTPVFLTKQKNAPAHRLNSSFWSAGQKLNGSQQNSDGLSLHNHLCFPSK